MEKEINDVIQEQKARVDEKYGPIKSLHEGYALALEEHQELTQELTECTKHLEDFWEGVKGNKVDCNNFYGKSLNHTIIRANRAIEEAIDLLIVLQRIKEGIQNGL